MNRALIQRAAGFTVAPMLAIGTPLVALPVVARLYSPQEWSGLAVGQSLGALAAIVIGAGWAVIGPVRVASQAKPEQLRTLQASLRVKLLLAAVTLPAVGLLAVLLAPTGGRWIAFFSAGMLSVSGFTILWFASGTARPGLAVRFEAIPRTIGSLGGAITAAVFGVPLLFPLAATVVPVIGFAAFYGGKTRRIGGVERKQREPLLTDLRQNALPGLTELSAALYTVGASSILAVVSPGAVALYSAADRLMRLLAVPLQVLGNVFQGWVLPNRDSYCRRLLMAAVMHTATGIVGFFVLASFGPELTALLFGPALRINRGLAIALALFYVLWSVETVTSRYILAALNAKRALVLSTLCGSAVGVTLIVVLGGRAGGTGAGIAVAIGCVVIVVMQVSLCRLVLRGLPRRRHD